MATGYVPIEYYRTKFYQREKETKKFTELTEEQLVTLTKKIYRKQEITEEDVSYHRQGMSKLDIYIKTLLYLTNPNIHFEMSNFDEKMAYLIMTTDPELITFKEFLKINVPSLEKISNLTDIKERNRLLEERKQIILEYETKVREQIGFCDYKLLKFEELFFKRFYNKKELITNVGQHNEDKFLTLSQLIPSFKNITDERFDELNEKAQIWLSLIPDKYKSKIATYTTTSQKELIGLNTLAEQFVFYILIVDGNLDMLRIYEEESLIPNVEERIKEEFGFYNKSLLELEKKFHERFYPNKKISVWSETK